MTRSKQGSARKVWMALICKAPAIHTLIGAGSKPRIAALQSNLTQMSQRLPWLQGIMGVRMSTSKNGSIGFGDIWPFSCGLCIEERLLHFGPRRFGRSASHGHSLLAAAGGYFSTLV